MSDSACTGTGFAARLRGREKKTGKELLESMSDFTDTPGGKLLSKPAFTSLNVAANCTLPTTGKTLRQKMMVVDF